MAPKKAPDSVSGLLLGRGGGALFHWSRVLGMAPFAPKSTPWAVSWAARSRGWEAYSLAVCAATTAIVVSMSYPVCRNLTGKFYKDLVVMSVMTKGLCGCCLHMISLVRRRRILRALNNILQYEALAGRGRDPSGGLVVGVQILAMVSVCAWTIALSWSFSYTQTALQLIGSLLFIYLPVLHIFTTDMQFGNLALLIHRQLVDLSKSTRQMVLVAQQVPQTGHDVTSSLARMTRLLRARQECIYSSVIKLSSAYSLQLLLSVTLSLEEATCGLYFVISSQYSSWRPLIAAWAVVHVGKLALLMTPCQWVESEAEAMADTVNSALQIRHISRGDREELEEFQVQLMHLKMRFSVGGVFSLDYSQLQKVISTITTFLVILLQMQGRPTKGKQPAQPAAP